MRRAIHGAGRLSRPIHQSLHFRSSEITRQTLNIFGDAVLSSGMKKGSVYGRRTISFPNESFGNPPKVGLSDRRNTNNCLGQCASPSMARNQKYTKSAKVTGSRIGSVG